MTSRSELERAICGVTEPHLRAAILGALLGVDSKSEPVITGGSAIAIRIEGAFVTKDVDLIGARTRLVPILKRWGFLPIEGRSRRRYWVRADLELFVDIINRRDYPGLDSGLLTLSTRFGPVLIAAAEDLILRRMVYWRRGGKAGYALSELMDQAVTLFVESRAKLDLEYLESGVRHEHLETAYHEILRLATAATR